MAKIDTKDVENDSLATILMDLIGLIGERALLPTERIVELMDRIVKIEKEQHD